MKYIENSNNYFDNKNNFIKNRDKFSCCEYSEHNLLKPIISIVIPTFNRPELEFSLKSALDQQKHSLEYEIIVVDNNPFFSITDQIINKNKDGRIKYFKNSSNLGMEGNWNRCIELANGKWISFLHDDDLLANDYLFNLQVLLEKNISFDILCSNAIIFTENIDFKNSNIIKKIMSKWLVSNNKLMVKNVIDTYITNTNPYGVPSCGLLIKKEVLEKKGGFNSDFFPYSDWIFLLSANNNYIVKKPFFITGYYRWSVNESQKIGTLIKFLNESEKIRQFSRRNFWGRFMYYFFRHEQHISKLVEIIKINPNFLEFYTTHQTYKFRGKNFKYYVYLFMKKIYRIIKIIFFVN